MSSRQLNTDEFIKFAKEVLGKTSGETICRRIMSGCYYTPKILAWDYADKILHKGLLEIARENYLGSKEPTDDIGFRMVVANEFDRTALLSLQFLHQSRVAADHKLGKMCWMQTRAVCCDIREAGEAIKRCEELVAVIDKKFSNATAL